MCVNDVLAQGAEPLFFLDYVALGKNIPAKVEAIVAGVAEGCRQAGCALVGGETAEMPGMYADGEYDIAGFTTGVVEKSRLIDGSKVKVGDVLVGVASTGVHSNGSSTRSTSNMFAVLLNASVLHCMWLVRLLAMPTSRSSRVTA